MSGADRFLPGAIAVVQEAIRLDKEEKYEEAMNKYLESLERFMVALKCTSHDKGCSSLSRVRHD